MNKVRINDLARELEVKSRAILDALTDVGVTEKKTHSSSLEADEAERVRQHFHRSGKNGAGPAKSRERAEAEDRLVASIETGRRAEGNSAEKRGSCGFAQRPPVPPVAPPQAARPSAPAHPVASASAGAAPTPGVSLAASAAPSQAPVMPPPAGSAGRGDIERARPGYAQPRFARSGPAKPGWAKSACFPRPAAACAAKDCSPASAGATNCGGPTAARPGNRSQAARWAGRGQAAGTGHGSTPAGNGARDTKPVVTRRGSAPAERPSARCSCAAGAVQLRWLRPPSSPALAAEPGSSPGSQSAASRISESSPAGSPDAAASGCDAPGPPPPPLRARDHAADRSTAGIPAPPPPPVVRRQHRLRAPRSNQGNQEPDSAGTADLRSRQARQWPGAGGPGFGPRPPQDGPAGARRPMHPTRTQPRWTIRARWTAWIWRPSPGFGARPGFGAPGRCRWCSRADAPSRGGAPAAEAGSAATARTPAVSEDQGRPHEGLCATASFRRSAGSPGAGADHPHHHGDRRHQRKGSCGKAGSTRQGS